MGSHFGSSRFDAGFQAFCAPAPCPALPSSTSGNPSAAEAMAQKCCCCIPLAPGVMVILVLLFLGDLWLMYSLRQNFGGWPWEFFQHGLDAFTRSVCLMWVFAIAEALVSVGVIFYAHKGIRTSSAAVLRYITGYASCKMFFETCANTMEAQWTQHGSNEGAFIVLIISLVLNICLGIHFIDVFKSLVDELDKGQDEKASSSAV